jgi:hypothetical protein
LGEANDVETDPNVLLALLAVRLLGGRSVQAAEPLLKNFKGPVKKAVEGGLLQEGKGKITTTTKAGKPSSKQVAVLNLTDQGEQFLRQAADPALLAATNAGYLTSLRQSLEADRQQLRKEVQSALKPKGKGPDEKKFEKELETLAKKVNDLAKQLQKLEAATQGADQSQVLTKIDQAFAAMTARLDRALENLPATGRTDSDPVIPQEIPPRVIPPPPPPPVQPESARAVLRNAYEKLICFREFQDGLVEVPRLYHEAHRSAPGLTVETFRRELESLWDSRAVELHVLNEVREAKEPDKAIRRDDKLYYFVYWPKP